MSTETQAPEEFPAGSAAGAATTDSLERALTEILVEVRRVIELNRADPDAVEALSELAASLEHSELLETERRHARQELLLGRAAQEVSSTLDPNAVYEGVTRHAASLTGATKALLTRLQPATGELAPVAGIGFSDRMTGLRHPLRRGMLGQVARTREPYLGRPEDAARWNRWLAESERIESFVHVPVELGPRLFGVLTVAHEDPEHFGEGELEVLTKLARASAAAIANAIDFQRERRIARALTRGFVPASLPALPEFEMGLLYEPASSQPTGGDLYGAWTVPSGELAVLVGDVAGKGVETASLSAMVRFFIEARTWDSRLPSEVISQANTMLRSRLPKDSLVTAFFALLSNDRMRYCNAGHLPPILLDARGRTRELEGRGLPLGVEEHPAYHFGELSLAPGELVFAYTDGLVEVRRGGELFGPARLAELVMRHAAREPLERLVRSVHDGVLDWAGRLGDDVVALALRRRLAS